MDLCVPFSQFNSLQDFLKVFQTSFLNRRENVFYKWYNKSEVFMMKWQYLFMCLGLHDQAELRTKAGSQDATKVRPDPNHVCGTACWPSLPDFLPKQLVTVMESGCRLQSSYRFRVCWWHPFRLMENLEAEKHLYKPVIFSATSFTLSVVTEKVSVQGVE